MSGGRWPAGSSGRTGRAYLDVVLDVGLEVEQDPRGLGGPLPSHVPRQDAYMWMWGPKWADR